MGNKPAILNGPLTEDEIKFLESKTTYSRDEILDLHRKFLNLTPNGKLNKKKFVDFFTQFRLDKDAEMFCSQLFNAFDTDRNGSVDFNEFVLAISLAKDNDPKHRLRLAFKMYDLDNDNKLSLSEIEKIITGIYNFNGQKNREGSRKPSEVAKYMLQKYDKEQKGYISEEDFMNSLADPTLNALDSFKILRVGNF